MDSQTKQVRVDTVSGPSNVKKAVTTDVEVGLWGGPGGDHNWKFKPEGRIREIHITCGGCIDSISFVYVDGRGFDQYSRRYGGTGGWPKNVSFAVDEELIGISGTYGDWWGSEVIKSICFKTNKKTTQQFGQKNGTSFSLAVTKGKIVGLRGNYGDYLYSLGVILHNT